MNATVNARGCSVTVLDYRGYGGSDGSPTEQGLLQDGAAAYAWLRSRQQGAGSGKGAASEKPALAGAASRKRRPVLWGESIGSGVAVGLLTDRSNTRGGASGDGGGKDACEHGGGGVGGEGGEGNTPVANDGAMLVLEAGFTSCVDLGASAYPWLPVRLGMLDRYESEQRAKRMGEEGGTGVPTLSLHGTLDDIAPIELGRRLFEALPSPRKRFVELEGTGHNDVAYKDPVRYLKEAAKFLSEEWPRS